MPELSLLVSGHSISPWAVTQSAYTTVPHTHRAAPVKWGGPGASHEGRPEPPPCEPPTGRPAPIIRSTKHPLIVSIRLQVEYQPGDKTNFIHSFVLCIKLSKSWKSVGNFFERSVPLLMSTKSLENNSYCLSALVDLGPANLLYNSAKPFKGRCLRPDRDRAV